MPPQGRRLHTVYRLHAPHGELSRRGKCVAVSLDLVDVYASPYEIWNYRDATLDELMRYGRRMHRIRTSLRASVSNSMEAAEHVFMVGTDPGLRNHVNEVLGASDAFAKWRRTMPGRTPPEIVKYQRSYRTADLEKVSSEIDAIGQTLTAGQFLFHAGAWPATTPFITDRPLSTTFCPDVALRNAEHRGKAFDAGKIDLLVLEVCEPKAAVFAFRQEGTNLGHENEVLFSAGAVVTTVSSRMVRSDYPVENYGFAAKTVSAWVHHALIS